jgi:transposase
MIGMEPYSEDLRRRIIRARKSGRSAEEVSALYEVNKRSVERYWKRYQETGSYSRDKMGRPAGSILDAHKQKILNWIKEKPGITLEQICERLTEELDIIISIPGLWIRLKKYGMSYKKNDIRKRAKTP